MSGTTEGGKKAAKTTTAIKRLPSQIKNADDEQTEIRGDFNKKSKKGMDVEELTRQNRSMPYLLNISQVCSLLNIGRSTLYVLVERQELPAVKVLGRTLFRPNEIENFINNLPQFEGGKNEFHGESAHL